MNEGSRLAAVVAVIATLNWVGFPLYLATKALDSLDEFRDCVGIDSSISWFNIDAENQLGWWLGIYIRPEDLNEIRNSINTPIYWETV